MTDKPRYDPQKHHRRSIRLKGYDYSQTGAYFITICTHNREWLFGEIVDGKMQLNEYGEIMRDVWLETPTIRPNVELTEWVAMPNHFHAIVMVTRRGVLQYAPTPYAPTPTTPTPTPHTNTALPSVISNHPKIQSPSQTIGAIVRGFKSAVAKRINEKRGTPGIPVWQRNYWEHIIRDEKSHNDIAAYIVNNPARWEMDELYVGGNL